MRLYLLLAVFAIMLSSYSLAVTENVFNDWVLPNQQKTTSDGRSFMIAPNEDDSKIAVDFSGGGTIVDKGDCRPTVDMTVCYDDVKFDHYNYSTASRIVNKYKVRIDSETITFNLTRTFTKLNPLIGEQVWITTKFLNTGNIGTEVNFYDNYSSSFEVFLSSPVCELHNNAISWTGFLDSLQSASCTYIIRPINKTSFSSSAYLEYNGKKELIAGKIVKR